jgi:hypothetical protein
MANREQVRRKKLARTDFARLLAKPTISPEELYLSGALSVGRNGIYDALKSHLSSPKSGNGIECFRVNRRIIIPTAPLRRKLGIEA